MKKIVTLFLLCICVCIRSKAQSITEELPGDPGFTASAKINFKVKNNSSGGISTIDFSKCKGKEFTIMVLDELGRILFHERRKKRETVTIKFPKEASRKYIITVTNNEGFENSKTVFADLPMS